jgi:hypothetical protein
VNVTIEVPVKDIHLHMATCIESGYNWFRWREVEADETGNGYLRARVVLFDDSYKLAEYTREALKAVLPTLPDGAVIVDWRSGYQVFRFDHTDFIRGLKACAERGIGKGLHLPGRLPGRRGLGHRRERRRCHRPARPAR